MTRFVDSLTFTTPSRVQGKSFFPCRISSKTKKSFACWVDIFAQPSLRPPFLFPHSDLLCLLLVVVHFPCNNRLVLSNLTFPAFQVKVICPKVLELTVKKNNNNFDTEERNLQNRINWKLSACVLALREYCLDVCVGIYGCLHWNGFHRTRKEVTVFAFD